MWARRLAYEADPDAFVDSCKAEQTALTDKLEAARQRLRSVKISEELQVRGVQRGRLHGASDRQGSTRLAKSDKVTG